MKRGGIAALLLAACAASAAAGPGWLAGVLGDAPPVGAELVAERSAIVPGATLTVGLRLVPQPHWHTYWQVPGDSGLATRIAWTLPEAWRAGPIRWPAPERIAVGPMINFGYDGTVLLLVDLAPPARLAAGATVTLAAHAEWLACREVCIPGQADLRLALPVATGDRAAAGPAAAEIARARALLPRMLDSAHGRAAIDGQRIRVTLDDAAAEALPAARRIEFFPLAPDNLAAAPLAASIAPGRVALELDSPTPLGDGLREVRGVLVADGGPRVPGGWAAEFAVPVAERR